MDLDTEQLQALIRVSQAFNASLLLSRVLDAVMSETAHVMHVEACSLGLLTPDRQHIAFEAAVGGRPDEVKKTRVAVGEGIMGWVAQHRQPALVNDVGQDPRFTRRVDDLTGFHTRSVLCVPVATPAEMLGVMEVLNRRGDGLFTERDERLLSAIASQAAIAIDNAHLHKRQVEMARLAALGEAMAGAAHGVRNVLTSMSYAAEVLETGIDAGDMDRLRRAWPTMALSLKRLQSMVLNMLAYCKGRQPRLATEDLAALCQEVCDMERDRAQAAGVRVRAACDTNDPHADIDAESLRHVLLNLIGNAIDACEDCGGEVSVAVHPGLGADLICISVVDTGCGMSNEVQQQALRTFFSTQGSTGTGLGLSVAKKVVEEHGGAIAISSVEGEGTTVRVDLPRHAANG